MNEKLKGYLLSVGKGALVAAAGAGLAFLVHSLSGADFGPWTPAVVAVASTLFNAARKALEQWEHGDEPSAPGDPEQLQG